MTPIDRPGHAHAFVECPNAPEPCGAACLDRGADACHQVLGFGTGALSLCKLPEEAPIHALPESASGDPEADTPLWAERAADRAVENAEFGAQVELSEWDWRGPALRESLVRNFAVALRAIRSPTPKATRDAR